MHRWRKITSTGWAVALTAWLVFAFAPLVHGMVHGDHQVEALVQDHTHVPALGDHDKGCKHPDCGLYRLCIAVGHSTTPGPDLVPPAPIYLASARPLAWLAPFLTPRDPPRGRGPPALLSI